MGHPDPTRLTGNLFAGNLLNNRLTTNLKKLLSDRLDFIYAKARKNATVKTGLPDRFPKQIPYSLVEILGEQ
jgi:hypothetical protein